MALLSDGPPELDELREAWDRGHRLTDVAGNAESRVARWDWYSKGTRGSLEPFHAEREGLPKGRPLVDPPDPPQHVDCVGIDDAGRVAVWRRHHVAGLVDASFHVTDGDTAWEFGYDGGPRLGFVTRRVFEDDRVQRAVRYVRDDEGLEAWDVTDYAWEGGKLTRAYIHGFAPNDGPALAEARQSGRVESFIYNGNGALERIVVKPGTPDGKPSVVWRRSKPRQKIEELRSHARAALVQGVEQAVRSADVDEPMWCLALQYEAARPLPPVVMLGSERERVDWGGSVDLMNPAEWDAIAPPRLLALGDEELLEVCARLSQTFADESHEDAAGAFLDSVAKELNEVNWAAALPASDGFFVYATDTENADVLGHIRAAVSPPRFAKLLEDRLVG